MRAEIISPDGTRRLVSPNNGSDFSLEEMQKIVGGHIELLPIGKRLMVLNEEGKLKGLPYNATASILALGYVASDDLIVGTVLVCDNSMVK